MRFGGRQLLTGLAALAATLVVFAGAALAGFELSSQDRILPGVHVLGIPLGGLTQPEAAALLAPRSAAILDQSMTFSAGTRRWATTPKSLGAVLDPAELAAAAFAVGHTGSPLTQLRDQVRALRSDTNLSVTSGADEAAIDRLLATIVADVDRPPKSAVLELAEDGTITFSASATGEALDQSTARSVITRALVDGRADDELPTRPLVPAVATEQVAEAHQQLVRMLSDTSPIRLSAAEKNWSVERSDLLRMITLHQAGPSDAASVELSDEPVEGLVRRAAQEVDQDAINARFTLSNGQLNVIRPSREGRAVNQSAAADVLRKGIAAGERTLTLPVDVVPPPVAADDAAKLGIRELIDESTTAFAGAIPEKAHNIQLAASRLNGVVVPPGGTFSFNKEVGPTTIEAGYQWGFGLTTGGQEGAVHTVPSVAGGICQVATTLFQPVFWAGYQLEERFWHLYWIPSYTSRGIVGLDATVDADAGLDLKWINPTADYVLIQASADAEKVTFRLYGRKPSWTVQVDEPVVSNRVTADPTPEVQPEPSLAWGRVLAVESARDGFEVLLRRNVVPNDGHQPRELLLKSIYAPAHTVTLVGTRGAPDAGSVGAAVERTLQSLRPAAPPASPAAPAPSAGPTTYSTPNGPRTLAQIREELRRAGWGGGSDQDALETYNRVAAGG
jgi:vancomycin resistance protein YoaR